MAQKQRFQFKLINTIAMLASVAVCLNLAHWQYGRINEKKQLQEAYQHSLETQAWNMNEMSRDELAALGKHEWQPVSVEGQFLQEFGFYLDSQVYKGKPGYHYLVPLQLRGTESLVLVNLGWIAAGPDRQQLPPFPEINIKQTVKGKLGRPKAPVAAFEQVEKETQTQAFNTKAQLFIDIPALSARIGDPESPAPIIPMVVLLDEKADGGLPRQWPSFNPKVEMHEFYVIHWLLVALAIILIYIYLGFRNPGKTKESNTRQAS